MTENMSDRLINFNVVKQMNMEINPFTLSYDLTLVLAESEELFAKELTIKFEDISELKLENFGGGLMQYMHLKITKINDGLERQKYEINELENDKISFRCMKFYEIEMIDR